MLVIDLPDLRATERLAAGLAEKAGAGDAILLQGALGAGKTAFARALLRHAMGDPNLDVPSPTFTLVQTYDLPGMRAHHFDLWQLRDPAGLIELGWEDALRDLVLVEWPDRLGSFWPEHALIVDLAAVSENSRRATLIGWPDRIAALA